MLAAIADETAERFYERLFRLDPSTKTLFADVDMAVQRASFARTLADIAASVDQFESVRPSLAEAADLHADIGLEARHKTVFGDALIWTIEHALGPHFTSEHRDAWNDVVDAIGRMIVPGEGREIA